MEPEAGNVHVEGAARRDEAVHLQASRIGSAGWQSEVSTTVLHTMPHLLLGLLGAEAMLAGRGEVPQDVGLAGREGRARSVVHGLISAVRLCVEIHRGTAES